MKAYDLEKEEKWKELKKKKKKKKVNIKSQFWWFIFKLFMSNNSVTGMQC